MSLLNSTQAHNIADTANEQLFRDYVIALHTEIKGHAHKGQYQKTVILPAKYRNKAIQILTHFNFFGYNVSINNNVLTIGW